MNEVKLIVDAVLSLLPYAVTWLLVVLGWLVVSERQTQAELAKNCYVRMHRLREEVRQIEKDAVEHHMSDFDEGKFRSIMRAVSNVGMEISHLTKRRHLGGGAPSYVTELRKAISSTNFEPSSYVRQSSDSATVEGIEIARDSLDRVLLEAADSVAAQTKTLSTLLNDIRSKAW